jgi:hypothetical protein
MKATNLELLPHLQIVVVGEVASQAVNLDARVLVLRNELEGDGHESVLLQRRNLARMRTGNLDLRVGLTDDVDVRNGAEEVLSVAVDGDAARRETVRKLLEREERGRLTGRRGSRYREPRA